MGRVTVKATYSLDEDTIRELEAIARRLGTSKSEAIRRAIALLARSQPDPGDDELAALEELQHRLSLSRADVDAWQAEVRAERLAAGGD